MAISGDFVGAGWQGSFPAGQVIALTPAGKLKPLGMFTGYHAHGFDFVRFGDRTAWDILFASTPADVIMQLDIGNCANGGGDPIAILRKSPGRARSVHLKDYGGAPESVIGEGGFGFDVSWRSLEDLRRMDR